MDKGHGYAFHKDTRYVSFLCLIRRLLGQVASLSRLSLPPKLFLGTCQLPAPWDACMHAGFKMFLHFFLKNTAGMKGNEKRISFFLMELCFVFGKKMYSLQLR